jgi:hypothetical protein
MPIGPVGNISGSGVLVDDPTMRLTYDVEVADANNKIQFVLRATDNITWWKSLDLFVNVSGSWVHSKRIETKKSDREAQVDYFDFEMTDTFKLEFWKGGVGGFGAYVYALTMDSYANLGQKIIFTWERDWG